MFKWYQNAAICYAYLDDVNGDDDIASVPGYTDHPYPVSFPKSRWFTRGWTLQELLAPSVIVFYSADWVSIGNRRDLAKVISETTRIDIRFFESGNFDDFSIAQRMSWASQRRTTRKEDQAYCLLGLFGVNMPLLYGEGDRAFVRLQQEIMKESDDQTIFAWGPSDLTSLSGLEDDLKGGILATSPKSFASSGHIVRSQTDEIYRPYAATNKGLQISLPLLRADTATSTLVPSRSVNSVTIPSLTLTTASRGNIAVLNCQPSGDNESRIGLYVEQHRGLGSYVRVGYQYGIASISLQDAREKATQMDFLIQIQNKTTRISVEPIDHADRLVLIQPFNALASEFKLNRTQSEEAWQNRPWGSLSSVFLDFSSATRVQKPCALEYTNSDGHGFVLILQKHVSLGKVTGLDAFIVGNTALAKDEAGVRAQVREAIYIFRSSGTSGLSQKSSNGILSIVPKITEARHASIVSLDARRAASSILESKVHSALGPPPLPVFEDITISITPPA
jgi:hypothetical protein